MSWQLVLLLVYATAQMGLGLWLSRHVRTSQDFFVAGRGLGPGLLFATLLAANIGAGSTVGAAGLGYRDGVQAWWWVGAAGLGSLVQALWVGPRMWREAQKHGFTTVGDFFDHRFGPAVRGVLAALLWFGTLAILAGQLVALSFLLEVMAGVPRTLGCALGGLVMMTYFVAGGLLSSAWVNLVQLVVLLLGFGLALPYALGELGGFPAGPTESYWNLAGGVKYLALLGPAFIVSPGLLQKVFGARDERAVRLGAGANAVALLVFAAVPPALGMLARVRHPALTHHEWALPTLFLFDLPPVLGSLGLAAVFSAEVSTCDAILFMLATSFSRDLYHRFVNPQASDQKILQVARGAAVAGGLLGVALAVALPSVISALTVFYTLLSVGLFVPLLGGLYWPALDGRGALAAITCGVIGVMVARLVPGFPADAATTGLLASLVGAAAVTVMRRKLL